MKIRSYHIYFSIFGTLGWLTIGTLSAKGEGDCNLIDINSNKPITHDQWKNGIDLDSINDVPKKHTLISYGVENVQWVEQLYNNGQSDYDYSIFKTSNNDNDNGFIELTSDFNNYEYNEISQTLKLQVIFYCNNYKESDIEFRIPIIDSNNHNPEFLKKSYKFTAPMPIPKGYHIDFVERIIVRDVDLTNNQITLNFDQNNLNEKFIISPPEMDPQNKKNYLTKLTSATTIDLEDDLTFTLIAKDSGKPFRTGNTTVTITVDKENSHPRFAYPLYTADLTKISYKYGDSISLEFAEGNVTVTRGYQGIGIIEIRGTSDENKKHFKLTHSGMMSENGLITYVQLNNVTEEFLKQKVLSVVLTAIKGYIETTTVLQILLPEIVDTGSKPETPCGIRENTKILQDDSTIGYMVTTIILSIISIGLVVFIIFLLFG